MVQDHYLNACSHILKKSALATSPFIKHCRCLHPKERTSTRSCNDILVLARDPPMDIAIDCPLDESRLLQVEKEKDSSKDGRIDSYWSQFFDMKSLSGNDKYPNVATVVKAVLSLSHGQFDVERGFSSSARTLTDDRAAMSEKTLDSYMMVKSAMQMYGNAPHLVPMTKDLLASARSSYSQAHLYAWACWARARGPGFQGAPGPD
ncbi:uncharacterized protein LOC112694903 [Athalia rosae]|uniref:uncharacterized protein LOC112694903 n=1 Tax=Athalia rosae TaxID=37344 RepID=UPI0020346879|nr:uncharacterized protein LOC112694903 [Athalia rosae]